MTLFQIWALIPILSALRMLVSVPLVMGEDRYNDYLQDIEKINGLITDEALAAKYLDSIGDKLTTIFQLSMRAMWDYQTNLTDYNQNASNIVSVEIKKKEREIAATAKRFDYESFKNVTLQRLFRMITDIGLATLTDDEVAKAEDLSSEMVRIYSTTRVTLGERKNVSRSPVLSAIMYNVGNSDKRLEAWSAWHDTVGPRQRDMYVEFVKLANKSAYLGGYDNLKDRWLSNYETNNIMDEIDAVWNDVEPLYKKLHAYVRKMLKSLYPEYKLPEDGTIPAHLLGGMMALSWENLYDNISCGSLLDVTEELAKQEWNASKLWRTAEDFFTSLGLPEMTDTFWEKSVMTKPEDRDIVCHASAWDFYGQTDFRIKMCTKITMGSLSVVHHEMGHIMYFMLYANQYINFREGANEGFHEAVGDLIDLSASTPSHYRHLGLLDNANVSTIDSLLLKALDKIAFLPFGYLLDKWRWSIFTGETPFSQMNRKFWEQRIKYQGISPPSKRNETHFDAGAQYHVPANMPYLRYFVSNILQFQFHEYLCNRTGQYGEGKPLHECNIYNHKTAGDILRKGLSLGRSRPWPEVLEVMAGTRKMSGSSIRAYFAPLETWLDKQIEGETIGWDKANVDDYME